MRVETIDEPIQVRADFRGGVITPVGFRRGAMDYRVRRVNVRWVDRERAGHVYHFSVTVDSGDTCRLRLDAGSMTWRLESVMMDG
jgi:hypothetical protein